jgi:putative heme-binding domain-containing protein
MHKVTRHVLTPAGATFASKDEDFVVCDSLDFHPTDVIEDADGSLLVIDTGGWYKLCCPTSQLHKPDVLGAIYRVRRSGAPKVEDPRGLKVDWKAAPEKLILLLDDPRPAVRWRAVQELAVRGPAALPALRAAITDLEITGRTLAVWAATRIDHPEARAAVRGALEDSVPVACAAMHSVSVWRDREAATNLLWMFKRNNDAFHRVLAEAMGRVGDKRHVMPLLHAAGKTKDPVLFHSLTYAVIEIGDPAATAPALADSDPGVRRAAMIALDQMDGGKLSPDAVTAALSSPDPALRDTAAWIAGRHPQWGDALAAVFRERLRSAAASEKDRDAFRRQLSGLAKSTGIQKLLVERLSDPAAGEDERRLVLATMASSELKAAPQAWADALVKTLDDNNTAIVADAVAALRKLPLSKETAPSLSAPLLRVAQRPDLAPQVRVEALSAVPKESLALTPELFSFLTAQVAPQQSVSVRVVAADVLGRAKLTPQQLSALAAAVKGAGPLEINRLLGAYEQSSDDAAGLALVAALQESKAARALRPEMVQPKLAKFGDKVRRTAEPLLASLGADVADQRKHLEELVKTLPPGDVRRGQAVFNGKQAACATCHAIGYIGGHVGPDLTRIGGVRAERDLLESIVYPSASFVQSYEPVLVDTKGGDRQSGILKKNDADEVVLITGPEQETRIARSDVTEMRPSPVSVMPAGLDQQLTKQDLADLVAFLRACK